MQLQALLSLVAVSLSLVNGLPQSHERRASAASPPKYVNADGTLDIVGLVAASRITPTNNPPTFPTNETVSTSGSDAAAVQQAQQQQSSNSSSTTTKRTTGCPKNANVPSTAGNPYVPQGLAVKPFLSYPYFSYSAKQGNTTIQSGNYTQIYENLQATYSNPGANSYLGQSTHFAYRPEVCSAKCDALKGCLSFDVYYERDPVVDPTVSSSCSDPASITNVVCTYYGVPISSDLATSSGLTLGNFQVVRAGVDGYQLTKYTPPYIPGYKGATRTGLVDNRVATGNGAQLGAAYASYNTYSIQYTSVLTQTAYFDPIFCKDVADTVSGAKSFSTWPLTVGGDPNSKPFAGAGGRYLGQGCIVYSVAGFPAATFDDPGQYGTDSATGNTNAFFSHSPNFHYDSTA